MNPKEPMIVKGKNGLQGKIVQIAEATANTEPQVLVQFEQGTQAWVPMETLKLQEDGTYYLGLDLNELQTQTTRYQDTEQLVLPVMAEELDVQKRTVATGGVRINKVVHEREEVVDMPLLREEVNVERVPINQYLNAPVTVRYEGDTTIIPIMEEVLVVEKRLLLREELRVSKRQTTTSQPQRVTLRSEEAIVDRVAPQQPPPSENAYS